MVDYIKALSLLEKTARGLTQEQLLVVLDYIWQGSGLITAFFIIVELEDVLDRFTLKRKKSVMALLIASAATLGFKEFIVYSNPPNYTRNEVRKVARTFGIENPQNLKVNIDYLRTIAPAYITPTDNKNTYVDDWVNDVLTKFYNDAKPSVEYEKIFQNLKK